ncbi:uncharacterized protein BDW47DRAFT_125505 [Aspergillus candidus]|uniref:Uncharacterized protein n=1 Tax=Aspergillus candidus TaxID=41067 RepID=A0A2I2FCL9_ASPCN|nr:hypothetical protein BDW47DRAFT_125505 [Aspergillus candidus]PLB38360.1 hypothetical protein BDW47DRAFT_125505 [Aspergillus candidus]
MTTAMVGSGDNARIAIIPLEKDHKAAYAASEMGKWPASPSLVQRPTKTTSHQALPSMDGDTARGL